MVSLQHLDHSARDADRRLARRGFARDFCITHFFNPPRYMRLLEVVPGDTTGAEAVAAALAASPTARSARAWCAARTRPASSPTGSASSGSNAPWSKPLELGLDGRGGRCGDRQADGDSQDRRVRPDRSGRPRSDAACRCKHGGALPATDPFHAIRRELPLIDKMIADGYTGRKGKGGFYRLVRRRRRQASRKRSISRPANTGRRSEARSGRARRDQGRACARLSSIPTRAGVMPGACWADAWPMPPCWCRRAPRTWPSVDEAMRLGYNWKCGPVRTDRPDGCRLVRGTPGGGQASRAAAAGRRGRPAASIAKVTGSANIFPSTAAITPIAACRRRAAAGRREARRQAAASERLGQPVGSGRRGRLLRDAQQDELRSIGESLALLKQSVEGLAKRGMKALVIYNEGENFSAGANLGLALFCGQSRACGR